MPPRQKPPAPPAPEPPPPAPPTTPPPHPGPRFPQPRYRQPQPSVSTSKPVDPAAAPLQQGNLSYSQGNWEAAIAFYEQALALRPNDSDIKQRIFNSKTKLQQARDLAAEVNSEHQIDSMIADMDNTRAAASAKSRQDQAINEAALAEIESFNNDMDNEWARLRAAATPRSDAPTTTLHVRDAVYFPALTGSAPLRGPSARVLVEHQPELDEVNRKIETTRKALERLIENNNSSNELREQTEHEIEKATDEAADVGLNLVIDLAGARLEAMGKANDKAAEGAFDELVHSDPTKPVSPELEEKCARLLEEKERLEKAEHLTDIAEKTKDAVEKMAPGEERTAQRFSAEDLYDVVTQIKAVGNLAGPSKDLIDAVYAMYHQASASMQLLRVSATNEKQYQAVAGLQRTLNKLRIQQRSLQQQQRGSTTGHPR